MGRQQSRQWDQHLRGPPGGSRESFTQTPLNLKRFFLTFVSEQINDIYKNPNYQKKLFFLLIFKYHLRIGGMVSSVGFPSHLVMGGQKKFKKRGQG